MQCLEKLERSKKAKRCVFEADCTDLIAKEQPTSCTSDKAPRAFSAAPSSMTRQSASTWQSIWARFPESLLSKLLESHRNQGKRFRDAQTNLWRFISLKFGLSTSLLMFYRSRLKMLVGKFSTRKMRKKKNNLKMPKKIRRRVARRKMGRLRCQLLSRKRDLMPGSLILESQQITQFSDCSLESARYTENSSTPRTSSRFTLQSYKLAHLKEAPRFSPSNTSTSQLVSLRVRNSSSRWLSAVTLRESSK